jgi:CRP/FNR family transcriptional regulator, cyclic AMP receptor protein
MQTVDALLRDSPVFQELDDAKLDVIAGCGSNVQFGDGETLFREGDPADVFYLVRHGTVSIETFVPGRGPELIATIGPGELLGWSWIVRPYRWHFDGRAVSPVRATMFDGTCLRGKCDADPELGYHLTQCFARVAVQRLQWTRRRLLDVYGNDERAR